MFLLIIQSIKFTILYCNQSYFSMFFFDGLLVVLLQLCNQMLRFTMKARNTAYYKRTWGLVPSFVCSYKWNIFFIQQFTHETNFNGTANLTFSPSVYISHIFWWGIKIARPMKMVHENAVFIREEAKLPRNAHHIHFQSETYNYIYIYIDHT